MLLILKLHGVIYFDETNKPKECLVKTNVLKTKNCEKGRYENLPTEIWTQITGCRRSPWLVFELIDTDKIQGL